MKDVAGLRRTVMTRVFWVVFALGLSVYLVMVLWTLPAISAAAGGLAAFDLRPLGYSLIEARAFLSALSEQGRALYLGPQALLDLAYPTLLASTIALGVRLLGGGRWMLRIAVPAAVGGALCDYAENLLVRRLLQVEPASVTEGAVQMASTATVLKSVLSTLALVLLLVALARWFWRRGGGRTT